MKYTNTELKNMNIYTLQAVLECDLTYKQIELVKQLKKEYFEGYYDEDEE